MNDSDGNAHPVTTRGRHIPTNQVLTGRHAEDGTDGLYFRCAKCGFINRSDRIVSAPRYSRTGEGITNVPGQAWGTGDWSSMPWGGTHYDFDVTGGCALCGTYLHKG